MTLTRLEPGIFSELPNLEEIDLSNNELIELDKDIFRNLSALDYLGLNGNKINWSCILPFLLTRQRSI
jgi:Leucine-rich repeat (LRR) protein